MVVLLVAQLLPESHHGALYWEQQHPLLGDGRIRNMFFVVVILRLEALPGVFYSFVRKTINGLNYLGKAQIVCKSFRNKKISTFFIHY